MLQDLRSKISALEQQRQEPSTAAALDPETLQSRNNNPLVELETTEIRPTEYQETPQHTEVVDEGHATDGSATPDSSTVANPLVRNHAAYISISGRLRYLGHSSTWSFTQQVLEMTHKSPRAKRHPRDALYVEGDVYRLPYERLFAFTSSDISGLPSLELSLYYLQSVKFRIQPLFFLFDEQDFTISLRQFYKAPMAQAQAKPLWFIHYLVIMSLGKALTESHAGGLHDADPRGPELLTRALQLLPHMSYLCSDPIQASEIFCSIALHLQSIDHRCAAHLYVSRLRSQMLCY